MSGLRYKALPGGFGPVFGILHDTLRVQAYGVWFWQGVIIVSFSDTIHIVII
jgi:hypothetical protein